MLQHKKKSFMYVKHVIIFIVKLLNHNASGFPQVGTVAPDSDWQPANLKISQPDSQSTSTTASD